MIKTTDHLFATKPFELFWVDQDIAGEGAASELATARAMAVLKNVFRAVKLVGDSLAQAATARGFTHGFNLPII